jgi:hypothetical protein
MEGLRMVVVPKSLAHDIAEKIKAQELVDGIELDRESRANIDNQLLCFFDEHGYLPEFMLRKRDAS